MEQQILSFRVALYFLQNERQIDIQVANANVTCKENKTIVKEPCIIINHPILSYYSV